MRSTFSSRRDHFLQKGNDCHSAEPGASRGDGLKSRQMGAAWATAEEGGSQTVRSCIPVFLRAALLWAPGSPLSRSFHLPLSLRGALGLWGRGTSVQKRRDTEGAAASSLLTSVQLQTGSLVMRLAECGGFREAGERTTHVRRWGRFVTRQQTVEKDKLAAVASRAYARSSWQRNFPFLPSRDGAHFSLL